MFSLSNQTKKLTLDSPLSLDSGSQLEVVEIAYRTWGRLNKAADNAIVICHALTGSADADAWWGDLVGPHKAIDTDDYFVICSNTLGGCYGSTGPPSLAPDGGWWGRRFPSLTIRDQVRAQIRLADALGINGIHAVIGGSLGGLQALEWAWMDEMRVRSVISIAASGRHSAWCLAWNEAQRMALNSDPHYRNGDYTPDTSPVRGLAAARAIAMISYRSPQSLNERFSRSSMAEMRDSDSHESDEFAVRSWLRFHGDALVNRFDAHSYRILIDAMDTHDLGRDRGEYFGELKNMKIPMLIGSIDSDTLYVASDQIELVRSLPNAELLSIDSVHGHDGFLIDAAGFKTSIQVFLKKI
jgi:homoserine O-acetyltransferase